MSSWTYVKGVVTVRPCGEGQRAKDFVLGSVVDHLPEVSGSEGPMHVEIVRRDGRDASSNADELGQFSNLGKDHGGGWFKTQTTYDLVLNGALRDREFRETLKEFLAWMNRLSKRVRVVGVLVTVHDPFHSKTFDGAGPWRGNFEDWSWLPGDYDWRRRPDHLDMYEFRNGTNWHYGIVPKKGNWTELLFTLLPGGHNLAYDMDYIAGNLEWYEYGTLEEYLEVVEPLEERIAYCKEMLRRKAEEHWDDE